MNKKDLFEIFRIDDLIHLPEAVMRVIDMPLEERDAVYMRLLEHAGHDVSYDWFEKIYMEELSNRKDHAQFFTPPEVGEVLAGIADAGKGPIHEPAAGTGGLVIKLWGHRMRKYLPWDFRPSENMVNCWEISDRSVPLLLLNLSIRGMMGYVYHGDTLEQKVKMKYILLNRKDDPLGFSEVIKDKEGNKWIQMLPGQGRQKEEGKS